MNNNIDKQISKLIVQKDLFMIACDSAEQRGLWNVEEHGEMKLFFDSIFVSTLLRLVASDTLFSDKEIKLIQNVFEIEYSRDEIVKLYDEIDYHENTARYIERLNNYYTKLCERDPVLGELFRSIESIICEIVIELDGVYAEEVELAKQICISLGSNCYSAT